MRVWIEIPLQPGCVFPFSKRQTVLNQTTYHGIYIEDGMVVFKGKKSVQDINSWLAEFQYTVEKAGGNQYIQFTAEICTDDTNLPSYEKEDKVQILTNNKLPFLDMKMSWSPEGDLQFEVFKKIDIN